MLKITSIVLKYWYRLRGITIKEHVRLWPGVFLSRGFARGAKGDITIERDCELSQGVVLKAYGGNITVGKNTFIGEYSTIYGHGGVEIGENTLIAMHTCIVSSNHDVPAKAELIRSKSDLFGPVKIGSDVWIGAGVKILAGVSIGDGSVIGAGSVVTKNLPPYAIAMGVPAEIKYYRND